MGIKLRIFFLKCYSLDKNEILYPQYHLLVLHYLFLLFLYHYKLLTQKPLGLGLFLASHEVLWTNDLKTQNFTLDSILLKKFYSFHLSVIKGIWILDSDLFPWSLSKKKKKIKIIIWKWSQDQLSLVSLSSQF